MVYKRAAIIGQSFNARRDAESSPDEWTGAFMTPPGASTKVILRWLGVSIDELREMFDAYNVYNRAGNKMSQDMVLRIWQRYEYILIFGQTAAKEFGIEKKRRVPFCLCPDNTYSNIYVFPHPSGRNRQLNDQSTRARCEKMGREIVRQLRDRFVMLR